MSSVYDGSASMARLSVDSLVLFVGKGADFYELYTEVRELSMLGCRVFLC